MKEPCKYHPGEQAVWYCPRDGIHFCSACVAEKQSATADELVASCFLCGKPVIRVARGVAEAPFWQILSHFVRYPLSRDAALLALAVALVAAVLPGNLAGLGILAALALPLGRMGNQMLEKTVEGQMRAPGWQVLTDLSGWDKALQQWLLFVAALGGTGFAFMALGKAPGTGIALAAIFLLPALLIQVQLEGNLLNVLLGIPRLFGTIFTIGLDYFFAVVFLFAGAMILAVAANIAWEFLPGFLSWPVCFLLAAWFWYATMHLLGYLTCQNREGLGYTSEAAEAEARKRRARKPEEERRLAVLLCEGRYRKVVEHYQRKLEKQEGSLPLNDQYFRLLDALGWKEEMLEHASAYLKVLMQNQQDYRVLEMVKRYRELDPGFRPQGAQLTWDVARGLAEAGHKKAAIQLLQDLHKRAPTWPGLPDAYLFIARLLAGDFNLTGKATQYIQFVETRFREPGAQEKARACREELGLAKG